MRIAFVFQKELAKAITVEQGKTLADAEGDVFRGLRKFKSYMHTEIHFGKWSQTFGPTVPLQRATNM